MEDTTELVRYIANNPEKSDSRLTPAMERMIARQYLKIKEMKLTKKCWHAAGLMSELGFDVRVGIFTTTDGKKIPHAWCEGGNYIIDATAGQFKGMPSGVVIMRKGDPNSQRYQAVAQTSEIVAV